MAFLARLARSLTALPLLAAGLLVLGLDLRAPIGLSTAAKLQALAGDGPRCRALLDQAGVAYRVLPLRHDGTCGYDDGVAWAVGPRRGIRYAPVAPPLACPLAAALTLWQRQVVQPTALRILGSKVVEIDHYGSYACRRLYGRITGPWSEHARAAAIDIAGFRAADGRRITVARDWNRPGAPARFLHAVRDGGCRLFATTLSPDYNAAHRDHLHLDEAARGGWTACR